MSDVFLIFPPIWDIYTPYTSIPALSGFLRMKGISVEVWDANIELHDYLISDRYLEERVLSLENSLPSLAKGSPERERIIKKAALGKRMLGHIDGWKQELKRADTDRDTMMRGKKMLDNMRSIIAGLSAWNSYDTNSINSLKKLRKESEDFSSAAWASVLKSYTESRLEHFSGRLVGISVPGITQLPYAFWIARWVKEKYPHLSIVMGGSLFPYMEDVLIGNDALFGVDFIVTGEGETALYLLVEAMKNNQKVQDIPNLIYADQQGKYAFTGKRQMENPNDLPLPDYTDFPMSQYFLEPSLLCYVSSRGCYWNKCAFCSLSCNYGHRYRVRDVDKVVSDLTLLKERYGMKYLFFNDESIHPSRLWDISSKMIEANLNVKWLAAFRFEDKITKAHLELGYKAGLRMTSFGLESAHQETLDLMRKGTKVETISRILRESHDVGIANHVFIMTNFPGDRNIRATASFIQNHADCIDSLTTSIFCLEKKSYIYDHPGEFGVEITPPDSEHFGMDWPYREVHPAQKTRNEDYFYMIRQYQHLPFYGEEMIGYDDRRLFIHVSHYGKETIQKYNMRNIESKQKITEFLEKNQDFYLRTNPEVMVCELEEGYLLCYVPDQCHAIYNESTCSLLQYAKEQTLFSTLVKTMSEIFEADPKTIARDFKQVIPTLSAMGFISITPL